MKNSAFYKFFIIFASILFGVFILICGFFTFYKYPIFVESETMEVFRSNIDLKLQEAYDYNYLGFRDWYQRKAPDVYFWRPSRVLYDFVFSGTDELENVDRYGVYAQVFSWDPENSVLGVYPYTLDGFPYFFPYEAHFVVDTSQGTTILIPQFDMENGNAPYALNSIDTSFVTDEEIYKFIASFESDAEKEAFVEGFETDEELTKYIAENFAIPSVPILQTKEYGPYKWEAAFCEEDIVFITFRDLKAFKYYDAEYSDYNIIADQVVVENSVCPTEYVQEVWSDL